MDFYSLEDFDLEEEDEEAEIRQRRLQRQAIVQVHGCIIVWVAETFYVLSVKCCDEGSQLITAL